MMKMLLPLSVIAVSDVAATSMNQSQHLHYAAIANSLFDDVRSQRVYDGRHLNEDVNERSAMQQEPLTEEEFDMYCELFKITFLGDETNVKDDDGKCSCENFIMSCTHTTCTDPYDGCSYGVCASVSIVVDAASTSARKIDVDVRYTGGDVQYPRERISVESDTKCESFITSLASGNEETKCNSCNVCMDDAVDIDCTNIQTSATTNGCVDIDQSVGRTSILDICHVDGVEKKTYKNEETVSEISYNEKYNGATKGGYIFGIFVFIIVGIAMVMLIFIGIVYTMKKYISPETKLPSYLSLPEETFGPFHDDAAFD